MRSVSVTLSLTNNNVRRLSVLWTTAVQRDGLTVALDVHLDVELTRTTPVNEKNDAKPSSEDAVVDVEVDHASVKMLMYDKSMQQACMH